MTDGEWWRTKGGVKPHVRQVQADQAAGCRPARPRRQFDAAVAAGPAHHVLREPGRHVPAARRQGRAGIRRAVGLLRALPVHPAALPRDRQVRQLRRQPGPHPGPGHRPGVQGTQGLLPGQHGARPGQPARAADEHHRGRAHRAAQRRAVRRGVLQGRGARASLPGRRPRPAPARRAAAGRDRRAVLHDHDGGRHRHRQPVRGGAAEHAAVARQLPAARRPGRAAGQRGRHRARVRQRRHPRRPLLPQPRPDDPRRGRRPDADAGQRRDRPPPRHRLPPAALPPGPPARHRPRRASRSSSRSSGPSRRSPRPRPR